VQDESTPPPPGRAAQRRRTRKAIVDATIGLLRDGLTPSIEAIAAAADVSRRTIYMYFPTLDQLLLDAASGALAEAPVQEALSPHGDDVAARVEALAEALLDTAPDTLPLGRRIVALTAAAPGEGPRRGYRRMQWIEEALEPVRAELTAEQYERLAAAVAVVIGWEAIIVLRDICGLDDERERTIVMWMARVLVEAMLAESKTKGTSHA
jgi:AcrR family transcriptional regulator